MIKHSFRYLHAAVVLSCGAFATAAGFAAQLEPTIVPTVHPTLSPASAIQVPLRFAADETFVWRADAEQRMLLRGHVYVNVGYRSLKADGAAVWLTPSRESGANTFDVAIYLQGNVEVREGNLKASTRTVGRELLVTTRVTQSVLLTGTPVNQAQEESPLVARGNEIRNEILNRPAAAAFIPTIEITSAEKALQAGWIAKGPNNRLIVGPSDVQVVRDATGRVIPGAVAEGRAKPAKPRPDVLITYDEQKTEMLETETVTILTGVYVIYDSRDGKPPVEFRAQRMVVFSPKANATQPAATATATAAAGAGGAGAVAPAAQPEITKFATGAYFDGDVNIEQGDALTVRAESAYYDFTSQRAIMLDATLATVDEKINVPIYMRAQEIRQLARGEFAAKKVTFSMSEFYTPHYHIGASEVYLRDITPQLNVPGGAAAAGSGGNFDLGLTGGGDAALRTYDYVARDATINVGGVPIFYWPYLAGDTAKNTIPLRTIRFGNSKSYGLSILTDWDLFGLAGQTTPEGMTATLNLDYFGKRGPGGGVQSTWKTEEDTGLLRTYGVMDSGTDRLGRDRDDIPTQQDARGRVTARDKHDLGDGLTLQLEASYISDPNFLEQYFQREFDTDKEQETSIYLKKQGETDALTFLGKFSLFDFTATADQVDDQFSTQKLPEVKYWRIGDSFFDMLTYYSESSASNVATEITDYTPRQLGLSPTFLGPPANQVPLTMTYKDYYKSVGWTTKSVLRGDTRHELDMPLQAGDLKIVPYVTARVTAWDDSFPTPAGGGDDGGSTTRVWGGGGVRSSMQFWKVYEGVDSIFWDLHGMRHVVEPQFNLFAGGANVDRQELQPFDRDVEGISTSSGSVLSLNQKWQTKRGGPGHWRDVDWLVLNVSWSQFYNKDDSGSQFFPQQPLRGFYFMSRPELSLVQNSISADGVWRVGERARLMGEMSYGLDSGRLEQFATGLAIDQTPSLSYFFGNRYIDALNTNEWTVAVDYQLTKKYQVIAAESYDFSVSDNILSSLTLIRRMPRFNMAVTVAYDSNNEDTSVVFTAWPEGFSSAFSRGAGGGMNYTQHR